MNFGTELFSEAVKIQQINVEDALSAAVLPASGSFIDVRQFERFAFLIGAGALNTETVCQVHQDKGATQTAAVKDISGATVTIAATGDDKWYLIEVQTNQLDMNNGFTHVALDITGATGGDDYAAIFFFGFGAPQPVTQGADKGSVVSVAG